MSIVRKWAFARAEVIDSDSVAWIAEARAGTGVWVIRDRDGEDHDVPPDGEGRHPTGIVGAMFDFQRDTEDGLLLLVMTPDQRASLNMSDETYQTLNVALRLDDERRSRPTTDRDTQNAIANLRSRLDDLERRVPEAQCD